MVEPIPPLRFEDFPRFADLPGRVALVTGGSAGIGAATAYGFAANGSRVVIADLDLEGAERLAGEIRGAGGEALAVACDITSQSSLEDARAAAEQAFAPVEILAPFAGGFRNYTPIDSLSEEEWLAVLDLNLTGTFRAVTTFLPGMLAAERGAIVTMGSSSARYLDEPVTAPYAAAKAGVVMMTRHIATELGPKGIRVNSVCPATTRSERVDQMVPAERQEALAALSPLQRMGYPVDVANATLYLASDAAAWVTGICLDVAGGRVMV